MAGRNHYPNILFYGSKVVQLILSIVIGATWSYVLYQQMKFHQDIPDTFFFVSLIPSITLDHDIKS